MQNMKYFNLWYLLTFLLLTGINIILNNHWTSDTGWMPLLALIAGLISILYWLVLSLISLKRKAELKHGLYYYVGLGLWSILMTIEYFKLKVIHGDIKSVFFNWAPYVIIVLLCLLPVKQIWIKEKENTNRQQKI